MTEEDLAELDRALRDLENASPFPSGMAVSPSDAPGIVDALKKHGKVTALSSKVISQDVRKLSRSSRRLEWLTACLIFLTLVLILITLLERV